MVNAQVIQRAFGISKSQLYRLVDAGRIRAHCLPRLAYHQRRAFLFDVDEVAADLAKLPKPKPPPGTAD